MLLVHRKYTNSTSIGRFVGAYITPPDSLNERAFCKSVPEYQYRMDFASDLIGRLLTSESAQPNAAKRKILQAAGGVLNGTHTQRRPNFPH